MKKRHTQTKAYIKEALTLLLTEEPFEAISVSKITRKSGINRGTFYLHYLDKYDLMDKLKEETLEELQQILVHVTSRPREMIQAALDYIQQDFAFFFALSQCSHVPFSDTIKEFLVNLIDAIPDGRKLALQGAQIPEDYAMEVLTASIESIISLWIAQGGRERTEEVTDIILKVSKFDEWE